MLQGHSFYKSDCGLSTDDNYAACLSPSHGSQSAMPHARRRRRSDLWKAFAEIASLDFLCLLLWFDLLFSVDYYLGMIGMRHWIYLCSGVKLDTGFDSNFQFIDVDLKWWCQFDFLYWLLGSELLFSVEYYLGTHSMKVKQFFALEQSLFRVIKVDMTLCW